MKHIAKALTLSCSLISVWGLAHSEEQNEGTTFGLSGFYSLTGLYVGKDDPYFLYAPQGDQDKAAKGEQLDFAPDTKLGLMGSVRFSPDLSAHVQVIGRRASSREPLLRPRLAYIEWRPTGQWTVQAGRYVLGLLMVEDSVYVDYGNLWIHPPQETYANVPKTELDGINLAYSRYMGDWTLRVQAAGGTSSYYSQQFYRDLDHAWGIDTSLMNSSWTIRLAHRAFNLNFNEAPAVSAATEFVQQVAIGEGNPHLVNEYSIKDIGVASDALGVRFEGEKWLGQLEISNIHSDRAFVPKDILSGYVLLGLRANRFTPYVIYGKIDERDRAEETRFSDPYAISTANYLRSAVKSEQSTASMGLRWDFSDAHALKIQWDRISRRKGVQGWFVSPPTGYFAPDFDNHVDVVSISLQGTF